MATDPEHEHARLAGRVLDLKPPGERLPAWSCACDVPKKRRHTQPADCLSQADVEAWRWRNADATVSDRGAKALAWLEREFGRR